MGDMLGSLVVGAKGEEHFGSWVLGWEVYLDHVAWVIYQNNPDFGRDNVALKGALKYVGWNRFNVEGLHDPVTGKMPEGPMTFNREGELVPDGGPRIEVYVHDWPYVRRALDFLYYALGAKIAQGTYEESFKSTEAKDKANDYPDGRNSSTLASRVVLRVVR